MGVHFERGQVLFEMGRYREAIQEYLAELSEYPDSSSSLSNISACLANLGDEKESRRFAEQAITANPLSPHPFYVLSGIELRRQNFEAAIAAINEALRLGPTAEFYSRLAIIHDVAGRSESVLIATESALKLEPMFVPAILLRGKALLDLGRLTEAHLLYQHALREAPNDADVHREVGRFSLKTGHAAAALNSLREARRLDPAGAHDMDALAEAYGFSFRPIAVVNRYVVYWHNWSFRGQWFAAILLTVAVCLVSYQPHRSSEAHPHPVLTTFMIGLINYLALPHTLPILGKSVAILALSRELGTRWYHTVAQTVYLLWIAIVHVMATLLGLLMGSLPAIGGTVCAVFTCHPLLMAIVKNGIGPRTVLVCLPLTMLQAMFGSGGVVAIVLDSEPGGYFGLVIFFAMTYFNERISRWASSVRLF